MTRASKDCGFCPASGDACTPPAIARCLLHQLASPRPVGSQSQAFLRRRFGHRAVAGARGAEAGSVLALALSLAPKLALVELPLLHRSLALRAKARGGTGGTRAPAPPCARAHRTRLGSRFSKACFAKRQGPPGPPLSSRLVGMKRATGKSAAQRRPFGLGW